MKNSRNLSSERRMYDFQLAIGLYCIYSNKTFKTSNSDRDKNVIYDKILCSCQSIDLAVVINIT